MTRDDDIALALAAALMLALVLVLLTAVELTGRDPADRPAWTPATAGPAVVVEMTDE